MGAGPARPQRDPARTVRAGTPQRRIPRRHPEPQPRLRGPLLCRHAGRERVALERARNGRRGARSWRAPASSTTAPTPGSTTCRRAARRSGSGPNSCPPRKRPNAGAASGSTTRVLHMPDGGQLNPDAALPVLQRLATGHGADIRHQDESRGAARSATTASASRWKTDGRTEPWPRGRPSSPRAGGPPKLLAGARGTTPADCHAGAARALRRHRR